MGILEKNKPHATSPRATLLDAGEKAATRLAPLVRTSSTLNSVHEFFGIAKTRAAGPRAQTNNKRDSDWLGAGYRP